MKKVLTFIKHNITFFILFALSLVFYLIAIFGGDYQTSIFFNEVTHYKFVNGLSDGVPLAFFFVLIPAIYFIAILVLHFFKPKKHDGRLATVFVAIFIAIATIAGLLLLLIPFALFKDSAVSYAQIADWKAASNDTFYTKSYNFPLLSMVISLFAAIVLGSYESATLS